MIPTDVVVDTLSALFSAKAQGSDDVGYRVSVMLSGPGSSDTKFEFYVTKESGSYRVRAVDSNVELGCEALDLHRQHRDKAARQWLGWAKEKISGDSGDDPLRIPPFVRLWNDGKGDVELAAASLCGDLGKHPDATDVLAAARSRSGLDAQTVEAVDHALARSYVRHDDGTKAFPVTERLLKSEPKSEIALDLELRALQALHRWNDYEKACRGALASATKSTTKRWLRERIAFALTRTNHVEKALDVLRENLGDGEVSANTLNDIAWYALFIDAKKRKSDEMLNSALQAAQKTQFKQYPALHTLAAVYLELGKVEEARQTLPKLLELDPDPRLNTWLIIGGLAEAYGLRDMAIAAYRHFDSESAPGATDSAVLARQRLKTLETAAHPGQ
jgi:tetratricopeptide (TPR) repeat protein